MTTVVIETTTTPTEVVVAGPTTGSSSTSCSKNNTGIIRFTPEQKQTLEQDEFHKLRIKRIQEVRQLEKLLQKKRRELYNKALMKEWSLIVEKLKIEWAHENMGKILLLQQVFERIKQDIGKAQRDAQVLNVNKPSRKLLIAHLNAEFQKENERTNIAVEVLRKEKHIHIEKKQEYFQKLNAAKASAMEREIKLAQEYSEKLKASMPTKEQIQQHNEMLQMVQEQQRKTLGGVNNHGKQNGADMRTNFGKTRHHQKSYQITKGEPIEKENATVMAARMAKIAGIISDKKKQVHEKRSTETKQRFDHAIKKIHKDKEHEKMLQKLENIQLQDRKRRQENIQKAHNFGAPNRQKRLEEIFSKNFISVDAKGTRHQGPSKRTTYPSTLGSLSRSFTSENSVEFTKEGNHVVLLKPTYE